MSTEGDAAATAEAVGLLWVGWQLSWLEGEVKALRLLLAKPDLYVVCQLLLMYS